MVSLYYFKFYPFVYGDFKYIFIILIKFNLLLLMYFTYCFAIKNDDLNYIYPVFVFVKITFIY